MSESVFLDTVGLLALWNRRDQWHTAARAVFEDLVAARTRLMTTSEVLLECGNAAARYPFRQVVVELRDQLQAGGDLLNASPAELEEAWTSYSRGDAAQAGIVDHISFAVMRREGLTRAFSNDQHFHAAGFETLF
jgi:predicted nucleic acid-binding protein